MIRGDQLRRRLRIRVTGTVQGVGFRPFVYREACSLALVGYVLNDSDGVLIEAEGPARALAEMCRALSERAPPLARVTSVDVVEMAPSPAGHSPSGGEFRIVESDGGGAPSAAVSVDTSTCPDCLAEVDDPSDRRHGYPFTNCTNCGPRYTIVISVPYDRPASTMAGFVMCPDCQREYDDPLDRRFHAQPNSCPRCGPQIRFCEPTGVVRAEAGGALELAVTALLAGDVVAVKGLGGYHLAVDATDEQAVAKLRRRKARDDKPFALMVPDLQTARLLCELDEAAAAALASPRRPIVLAPRRSGAPVAEGVAPGLPELGLILAYTPLHHLLLGRTRRPLVMTSGNASDDPIAYTEDDAFERLSTLTDGVLAHDRPIHIRCDDSVIRATPYGMQTIRRSRGYAPEPLALAADARRQVLAVGAELKSTVSVAKGRTLITSHHIGDLEHLAAYRSFEQATGHLCRLFGVEPEVVVHDLHPEYLSSKYALEIEGHDREIETWAVQHHHAHVASCMAEHRRLAPVLGIAFDGLGFGPDGVLWGGEFLVADLDGYERAGHLRQVPMPGGQAAIREPWRMALAVAATAAGLEAATRAGRRLDDRWPAVLRLVERGMTGGTPSTTSAGRLFDAVSALVGLRSRVSYEGQAAIELEAAASGIPAEEAPRYPVESRREGPDGLFVLDWAPLVSAVLAAVDRGDPVPLVAAGFHRGLAAGAVEVAMALAVERGLDTVVLTGGVFQNIRLTELVAAGLRAAGLEVLLHREVPPNDGGISIGQAAIGALATTQPSPHGRSSEVARS